MEYAPEEYTKHYIVTALFKLMNEYDYTKISVSDIAQKAGIGRATFYRYFKSKEEVIIYYFQHHTREFVFKQCFYPRCREDYIKVVTDVLTMFKDNIELIKIFKGTTNIWHEKHNDAILSAEWQNKKVYLCGVLSDVCVKEAMDGLLKRGAEVCVLEDLCLGLNRQIGDILNDEVYRPFINAGKLHSITSAQFFRTCLLEKKAQHNSVHFNKGNNQ